MKSILTAAAAAIVLTTGSAMAWEGRTVACFDKHWVGPTYKSHHVLVKPAKEKYEHVNHRIELVRYAAVWSCHGYVPVSQLIYAAFRSNAKGLLPPSDEWRRRGL